MKVGTLASIFPTLNQSELLHVLWLGKAFLLKTLRLSITQTLCKLYVGFISSFVLSFVSKEGEPSTNYVKYNSTQIKWYIYISVRTLTIE